MCYRQRVIAQSLGSPTSLCNRRKKQGGISRTCSQRVPSVHGLCPCVCLLSSTTPLSTVQTRVQCNDNSTGSYENQSVVFCTQNCIKACQKCFKHALLNCKYKKTLDMNL
jgi:hypothetical protein